MTLRKAAANWVEEDSSFDRRPAGKTSLVWEFLRRPGGKGRFPIRRRYLEPVTQRRA